MKKKLKYEKKTIDNEHISKIVNKVSKISFSNWSKNNFGSEPMIA